MMYTVLPKYLHSSVLKKIYRRGQISRVLKMLCYIAIKTRDYIISDENMKRMNFLRLRVPFICIIQYIVGHEFFIQDPELNVRNEALSSFTKFWV